MFNKLTKVIGILLVVALFGTITTSAFAAEESIVEIAVNDAFLDAAIDAIIQGARSGDIGDGKIFVEPLLDCVRIRTGERGAEAIGP